MNLFNAYKYLYYRIYSFQLRWFGDDDLPEYTAVLSVSLLTWWNIFGLLSAIASLTRFKVIDPLNVNKVGFGLGLIFIIGVNSFVFLRKKHYKKIVEQFKDESNLNRKVKLFLIFAYIVFSLVFPFII